ncbi:hypothetical protein J6590_096593, partial [Homalodisca vitripennis]
MAMGSPLSPIFANIFMEEFERKALASAQFKPKIWWRGISNQPHLSLIRINYPSSGGLDIEFTYFSTHCQEESKTANTNELLMQWKNGAIKPGGEK